MFRWQGDRAIVVAFDGPLADANARARAASPAVATMPGVAGVVPAARTILVRLAAGADPAAIAAAAHAAEPSPPHEAAEHMIVVAYDGTDLQAVAGETGLTEREVVALHAGANYTVAFGGFMPGFAYLLGLPSALHVPRLSTPRTRIDAGSVAIAGPYSGVYPSSSPGGWRILGRSDATLFDPGADPPATLVPGDRVRFVES